MDVVVDQAIVDGIMSDPNIKNGSTEREYVVEYVKRLMNLETEIDDLKEAKKDLKDEFKDKIDMSVVAQVLRTINILKKVSARSTYDNFLDILEKELNISV